MTSFDAGDIVLVRYPFTDLSTLKKHPAIILSPQAYSDRYGDVVLMPLTSQPDAERALALGKWQESGLLKPSWVKPIIGTLATRMIEKHLGKVAATDESCVKAALAMLLEARWARS